MKLFPGSGSNSTNILNRFSNSSSQNYNLKSSTYSGSAPSKMKNSPKNVGTSNFIIAQNNVPGRENMEIELSDASASPLVIY